MGNLVCSDFRGCIDLLHEYICQNFQSQRQEKVLVPPYLIKISKGIPNKSFSVSFLGCGLLSIFPS